MSTTFDLGLVVACAFLGAIGALLAGFGHAAFWLCWLSAVVALAGVFAAWRRP